MLKCLEPVTRPFVMDDALIESVVKTKIPQFSCYHFSHTAIVAGRGSLLSRELQLDHIAADHIPVYRRQGGGCSVFLDSGCLVISIALPAKGFAGIRTLFDLATCWLIQGLTGTGIKGVYQDGISDLVIKENKIGGSCLKRSKDFAYFSASLLVSADLDRMEKYLKYPPREPAYRQGRSHLDFVKNLDQFYQGIVIQDLSVKLEENLDFDFSSSWQGLS